MAAMKNKEYILFDLDGTIVDSGEGVTNSFRHALRHFGIEAENRASLNRFVGPPLHQSFREAYGFSAQQTEEAVEAFRAYYREKGVFECHLYPGMAELLAALNRAGKKVLVATSKPAVFAEQILHNFDVRKHFAFVSGSELNGERVEKEAVIRYAFSSCNITDYNKAVMIGDRKFDIIGARSLGVDSIGVLYGYGSREELEAERPTALAENTAKLSVLLGV